MVFIVVVFVIHRETCLVSILLRIEEQDRSHVWQICRKAVKPSKNQVYNSPPVNYEIPDSYIRERYRS